MDDNKLAKRAASGDSAAFERLVKTYESRVYTMAYRMTGNHEDASDLTQDAFIRVWRSLDSFKGEAKFSTWLYRVVSNLCADYGRKRARTYELPLDEEGEHEITLPDVRYEPDRMLENKEVGASITQAVDTLSPEHREIFIMREIYDMTYAAIADALGIEEGTVKSRLFRARENLRDILTHSGNITKNEPSKNLKGGDKL